jgi:hypothetical protein
MSKDAALLACLAMTLAKDVAPHYGLPEKSGVRGPTVAGIELSGVEHPEDEAMECLS